MNDGLLLVDKPQGVTSFDAVAAVRGALRTKKVGHAGTLDPMATGMLVIGFGRATRLLQYIVEHDKTYEATIRLGASTTTDDADGAFAATADGAAAGWLSGGADGLRRDVERVIAETFLGDIEQVPNTFSAIKVNGQRAYDLAREGKDVALKARAVHIAGFDVLDVRPGYASAASPAAPLEPAGTTFDGRSDARSDGRVDGSSDATDRIPVVDVDVRVSCSSGTYIRALGRDLGTALGVGGYLTRLRRTRVGRFALPDDRSGLAVAADAIVDAHAEPKTFTNREGETVTRNRCVLDTPDGLSGEERGDWLRARAIGMADAARGAMTVIDITADQARELRFGRRIDGTLAKGVHYAAIAGDDVAAIVERANRTQAKPVVVFPKD
ncbi:tRNA pseudouridine(55) synthase TruB [Bifidobacterium saguinibicoloris]|uniref:tRNA pseudouridine(55) synthase TruB n=1 Tax=Bifidobacterium saguinibicoloris TaxID=2834433 RepID=UPI001C572EA9|nr:tRNA pseudouridine(55) synthase TruB [Bifidobacterium saguinibicoloris]MBW3081069.1 tRNA pseudouridine(55) synthase TruB [Bifidobacterium saguinibicoloris]